jgi:hypothetical protein
MISLVKRPKAKESERSMETDDDKSEKSKELATGLSDGERASLLRSCVALIQVPI